jgi:hypothetical protein
MPNVLEAPEVLQETQGQRSQEATHPIPVLPPTRQRRLFSIYTSLRALVASYLNHHPHQSQRFTPHHQQLERPIDTLARKYPFIFFG